jgi:hypothetical protein
VHKHIADNLLEYRIGVLVIFVNIIPMPSPENFINPNTNAHEGPVRGSGRRRSVGKALTSSGVKGPNTALLAELKERLIEAGVQDVIVEGAMQEAEDNGQQNSTPELMPNKDYRKPLTDDDHRRMEAEEGIVDEKHKLDLLKSRAKSLMDEIHASGFEPGPSLITAYNILQREGKVVYSSPETLIQELRDVLSTAKESDKSYSTIIGGLEEKARELDELFKTIKERGEKVSKESQSVHKKIASMAKASRKDFNQERYEEALKWATGHVADLKSKVESLESQSDGDLIASPDGTKLTNTPEPLTVGQDDVLVGIEEPVEEPQNNPAEEREGSNDRTDSPPVEVVEGASPEVIADPTPETVRPGNQEGSREDNFNKIFSKVETLIDNVFAELGTISTEDALAAFKDAEVEARNIEGEEHLEKMMGWIEGKRALFLASNADAVPATQNKVKKKGFFAGLTSFFRRSKDNVEEHDTEEEPRPSTEEIVAGFVNSAGGPEEISQIKEVVTEIDAMNPKDKEKLSTKFWNLGYTLEEQKERKLSDLLALAASKSGDKDSVLKRFFKAGEIDASTNADSILKRRQEAGVPGKVLGNTGYIVGNTLKGGRIVGDFVGWTSAAPYQFLMMITMFGTRVARIGKETRFANEKLIEKNRHEDAELAYNEAWDMYAKAEAENGGEIPDSQTLKDAYTKRVPQDILDRLARNSTLTEESGLVGLMIRKDIARSVRESQKKIDKIEASKIPNEAKEAEINKILSKWQTRLHDYDRMISQAGEVDAIAMLARSAETTGKLAKGILMVQTADLLLQKANLGVWQNAGNFFAEGKQFVSDLLSGNESTVGIVTSATGTSGSVLSDNISLEPEMLQTPVPVETMNGLDNLDSGSEPTPVPVEYKQSAQSGDSVWKMIDRQLTDTMGDNYTDLSPGEKTHMVDAIKDKIVADPQTFGLSDPNRINVGQELDFSSIFEDQESMQDIQERTSNLTPEQINNIENYSPLQETTSTDYSNLSSEIDERLESVSDEFRNRQVVDINYGNPSDHLEQVKELRTNLYKGTTTPMFKHDIFGNITDIAVKEAPKIPVSREEMISLFSDPRASELALSGRFASGSVEQQLSDTTHQMAVLRRLHGEMKLNGQGNSAEAYFIRNKIAETVRLMNKEYGNIYKTNLVQ